MDHSVISGFGNRLRLLRLSRELSQSELARSIGRHQTAIGPYERGEYMPARDVVEKLARILDTSPEYLLFGRSPHRSQIEITGATGAAGIVTQRYNSATVSPLAIDDGRLVALVINDRSMEPALVPGDHALIQRTEADPIETAIGGIVLAELDDGRQLVRKLLPGARLDRYDLAAHNAPTWHDVSLKRAQPVVGCLQGGALFGGSSTTS